MKRLMVYTKRRKINISDFILSMKSNSGLMLVVLLYTCGLIIGSVMGCSVSISEGVIGDSQVGNGVIYLLFPIILFVICFAAGLSCLGVPICCCIPVILGYYFGYLYVVEIFNTGINSYIKFLFNKLLSSTLISLSVLSFSDCAFQTSAEIAGTVILNKEKNTDIKQYLVKFAVWLLVLLFGILIEYISM